MFLVLFSIFIYLKVLGRWVRGKIPFLEIFSFLVDAKIHNFNSGLVWFFGVLYMSDLASLYFHGLRFRFRFRFSCLIYAGRSTLCECICYA